MVRYALPVGAAICVLIATVIGSGVIAEEPGVTPGSIYFGQSAPFTGAAAEIGKDMRIGLEAAFNEINSSGGIEGRHLYLRYLDDGYEPGRSITNVRNLIKDQGVFAFIGSVGAPSSNAVAPITEEMAIPFIAPITGISSLRDREQFRNVINLRPSYQQEINEMIERLTQDRGVSRVAVLYQDDSFGRAGYDATIKALSLYGLKTVARGTYPRNTSAVKTALFDLKSADPEAIIIVGAYEPVSTALKWADRLDFKPIFMTLSLVGSKALATALGGGDYDLFMTQVVPNFAMEDTESAATRYRAAIDAVWPGTKYGYVSFEGYLAGRLAIEALAGCGQEVRRDCFVNLFQHTREISIEDIDFVYGEYDSQGLDDIYLTAYHPRKGFIPVRSLNDDIRMQ